MVTRPRQVSDKVPHCRNAETEEPAKHHRKGIQFLQAVVSATATAISCFVRASTAPEAKATRSKIQGELAAAGAAC